MNTDPRTKGRTRPKAKPRPLRNANPAPVAGNAHPVEIRNYDPSEKYVRLQRAGRWT